MTEKKLSIIIPVYNEKDTIRQIIEAVERAPLPAGFIKEIIIIDDGSTDGTAEILRGLDSRKYKIIFQEKNQGKGAVVRAGLNAANGDYCIIQDADLEYNPEEYPALLGPLLEGRADIVYGSRFLGSQPHRALFFWHYLGNKILTTFANLLINLNLSDMETGYKCFNRRVRLALTRHLSANRFGVEPEITAIVARKKFRVYEVGISYFGRTYADGKKITWRDGMAALWFIFYYSLVKSYK